MPGAWLVDFEPAEDERGSFARTFCARTFAEHGLETTFVQHSLSHSRLCGTLRGMHFQTGLHAETKLVRCARGAIWDVIVDLRPGSPTFGRWTAVELSEENNRQLYIPAGFAHGFQSLSDAAEVHYLISAFYEPAASSGVRWDDPFFAIEWPMPPAAMSGKDRAWPDFRPA